MIHRSDPAVFCQDFVEFVADDLLDSEPPRRVLVLGEGLLEYPFVSVMEDVWGDVTEVDCVCKMEREALSQPYDLVVTQRFWNVSADIVKGLSEFGSAIALLTPWDHVEYICQSGEWIARSVWVTEIQTSRGPNCWVTWRNNYEGPTMLRWIKAERAKKSLSV